jgi:SAM-dependent methyltransferase
MKYYHPRFLFRRYEIMRLIKKGKHFLEIGPGNLGLALELLSNFAGGTLIDFNTTDVQQIYDELKESQRRRLELVIADFTQYDSFTREFDCVVACEVMEHIENDMKFLQRTNELLAPSGQLILSVPARMKFWSTDDEIVGHYRRYEKAELYAKLVQTGYFNVRIISYGFPFENIVRLLRISLARFQYREKTKWDQKKQSEQSAFIVKRIPQINLVGLILNKYSLLPFNLISSLFNEMDLADGYLVSATKKNA